jgi:TldD protein
MESSLQRLVPITLVEELLGLALSKGADFSEVYIERSRGNRVSLEEHKIRTASYGISLGVGVRAIAGMEVGYAYSDDIEPAALREASLVAAAIAQGQRRPGPVPVQRRDRPDRYPVTMEPDEVAPRAKADLLLRGDGAAHGHDERITQVMGSFTDSTKEVLIANSDGVFVEDLRVMFRLSFMAIADDGKGDRRTGSYGGGGRVPFGHYEKFSPERAAAEAARMAVAQIGAVEAPAGPQTVVLSPGWSGVLLHEADGHGLEADFIHKGTSLYAGKIGARVASELCTVIDNGELPHRRGSLNVDDEGEVAQQKVLIEDGVLSGYMVDRLSGRAMGLQSTGNGRRESYRHAPMPRMTNTYLAPGPHTHDEILASVRRGLYCAAFGGGQVDISNGNFVFGVREGYLIEDGRLTAPVRNHGRRQPGARSGHRHVRQGWPKRAGRCGAANGPHGQHHGGWNRCQQVTRRTRKGPNTTRKRSCSTWRAASCRRRSGPARAKPM